MKLRAAIVGLGKIGIDFDLLENRSKEEDIWTHYAAYRNLSERYDLVAAVETNSNKVQQVNKFDSKLKIFEKISDLKNESIDVISICTPEYFHLDNIYECMSLCNGIFVEKPLIASDTNTDLFVLQKKIHHWAKPIYVNYYKREEPAVLKLLGLLKQEKIYCIQCKYSGPLDAVGSHAIDLINFIRKINKIGFVQHHPFGSSAFLVCEEDVSVHLIHTGERNKLIFELEIITDKNRYILENNLSKFKVQNFQKSFRYKDYFELNLGIETEFFKNPNRLVGYLKQIHNDISCGQTNFENFDQSIESQSWLSKIKLFE